MGLQYWEEIQAHPNIHSMGKETFKCSKIRIRKYEKDASDSIKESDKTAKKEILHFKDLKDDE